MHPGTTFEPAWNAPRIPFTRVIVCSALCVVATVSNAIVLATFVLERPIRKHVSNIIIVNLSISDFMVGCFSLPFFISEDIYGGWTHGEDICKFHLAVSFLLTSMPVFLVILLTLQRRLAMCEKTRYRALLGHKCATLVIIAAWITLFAFFIFLSYAWPEITDTHSVDYSYKCDMEYYSAFGFSLFMLVFENAIPFIILVALCMNLTLEIYKRSRRIGFQMKPKADGAASISSNNLRKRASCQDNPSVSCPRKNDLNQASSTSKESQSAADDKRRPTEKHGDFARYRKAYISLGVLVMFYLICWLPYVAVNIISMACPLCVSFNTYLTTIVFLYSNSAMNPFLYALTNIHYRRGFINVLRLPKRWL
ncbi:histamine H3 receptor-like [Diadema antillarum]|uniref:histamine H3 receptor-like n=1 Tax=Diadema antillarum TaxID=105358 RepID=UPI003A875CA4